MTTLYYAPGAASLVVHWILLELDIPHALERVDTASGAQKRPEYLALNPNGVVPTLVIDGRPHYEAAALIAYLADRHPERGLAPLPADPDRMDFLQWMFNLANMVQPLFRQWWYPHEPAGEDNARTVLAHVQPRIEAQWSRIDAHLAANGPWLLGERLTVADFYLAMLLRWSRKMPKQGIEWSQLNALAQRLASRPSFAQLYAREELNEWP